MLERGQQLPRQSLSFSKMQIIWSWICTEFKNQKFKLFEFQGKCGKQLRSFLALIPLASMCIGDNNDILWPKDDTTYIQDLEVQSWMNWPSGPFPIANLTSFDRLFIFGPPNHECRWYHPWVIKRHCRPLCTCFPAVSVPKRISIAFHTFAGTQKVWIFDF